jgi:SAM-dependent methyltransferase
MPRINNDKFYKNALKKYGKSAKGLNWHDEDSQVKRFEIIRELLEDDVRSKDIIIDAGCGFGDLYPHLLDLDIEYIGYEIVKESVKIAIKNTNQKIYKKDILTDSLDEADFYIASGSMNILSRFETFLFIEKCFGMSKKGFIFNLPYGKDDSKSFNYFLPQEIKHFAKKFDCEVITKSGYLPNDFTIYLKKQS